MYNPIHTTSGGFDNLSRRFLLLGLCVLLTIPAAGCQRPRAQAPPPAPPVIPVSHPVQREVTDYADYTGRADAVQSVAVRPRVSGYLTKMPFKEGSEVKKDDLLFEIDPRPYKALVDQAQSQVTLAQAQAKLAQATYARDLAATPGTFSPQQIDQDKAAVEEAKARITAAQAVLEAYKLNLSFTEVRSPIDGQVSRYYYTLGNLAIQDQTLLTTIVSLDPMYAYFDMDERTILRIRNAINEGRMMPHKNINEIQVYMALEGEDDYPHKGSLNFVNNAINPSTGTIAVRGVFANPLPKNGRRLLSPGMFVRIRIPISQAYRATLVIDRAIGSDQGLKFVYVVDSDNKVRYRRIKTGPLQDDGLRVVEGVKPDEWVVVSGLQQVRPRMEIEPEREPMPVLNPAEKTKEQSGTSGKPQPPPPGEKSSKQSAVGSKQSAVSSRQ